MSDFLDSMAASSAERARHAVVSEPKLRPRSRLDTSGFGVIAEIKNRSPAEGALADAGADRSARARVYAAAGARAISVLTEPERFDGHLDHLAEVVDAVPGTPVMRKDFLVDPVQVREAHAVGASGVLLITALLDDRQLDAMLDCAWRHDLFVLLEAFGEDDLTRAHKLLEQVVHAAKAEHGELLFGVNSRNLRTLEVDATRLERYAALLPPGVAVAESGLKTARDAERVAAKGYGLALVGTALMRSPDPGALIRGMTAAAVAA
ncbi:MAG: indole-3-glycerol-phosphate synthase [Pseudomonadota bacterium]